jgi:hypothetical protein
MVLRAVMLPTSLSAYFSHSTVTATITGTIVKIRLIPPVARGRLAE